MLVRTSVTVCDRRWRCRRGGEVAFCGKSFQPAGLASKIEDGIEPNSLVMSIAGTIKLNRCRERHFLIAWERSALEPDSLDQRFRIDPDFVRIGPNDAVEVDALGELCVVRFFERLHSVNWIFVRSLICSAERRARSRAYSVLSRLSYQR